MDVTETVIKIPVGTWAKDKESKVLGAWSLLFLNTGVEGFSLYLLTSILGVSLVVCIRLFWEDSANGCY